MKKFTFLFSGILIVMFVFSCGSDRPDYVGTWVGEHTFPLIGETTRLTATLTEDTWKIMVAIELFADNWFDILGLKGTMIVSESNITLTVTHVYESIEQGVPAWYGPGTEEFYTILLSLEITSTTFNGKYSVSGDQITLFIDFDDSGVYEDGEIFTGTRQ